MWRGERVLILFMKNKFVDGPIVHQMFLDDSLQFLDRHVVIPDSFRINSENRSALADTETMALAPVDPSRPFAKPQLFQARLQISIKRGRGIRGTARPRADKNMFAVRLEDGLRIFHGLKKFLEFPKFCDGKLADIIFTNVSCGLPVSRKLILNEGG